MVYKMNGKALHHSIFFINKKKPVRTCKPQPCFICPNVSSIVFSLISMLVGILWSSRSYVKYKLQNSLKNSLKVETL